MSKEHLESIVNARIASGQFDSIADIERRSGMKLDVLRNYFKGRIKSLKLEYSTGLARSIGVSSDELAAIMFSKDGGAKLPASSVPLYRIADLERRGKHAKGSVTIDDGMGMAIPARASKWVVLDDDAMSPTAKKGDAVLMVEDAPLKTGGLYFMSDGDTSPILRRVKVRIGSNRIDALTDNPDFPSEENISQKSLKILGAAAAVLKFI